jgi:hypothetical protein
VPSGQRPAACGCRAAGGAPADGQFDRLPWSTPSASPPTSCRARRGIGALLLRDGVTLAPQLGGGGQEGLRAGHRTGGSGGGAGGGGGPGRGACRSTAAGDRSPRCAISCWSGCCCIRASSSPVSIHAWTPTLGCRITSACWPAMPEGQAPAGPRWCMRCGGQGFAVSSGSACSSGQQRPSPTLLAMGYGPEEAQAGLRISLGPWHTDTLLEQLPPGHRPGVGSLRLLGSRHWLPPQCSPPTCAPLNRSMLTALRAALAEGGGAAGRSNCGFEGLASCRWRSAWRTPCGRSCPALRLLFPDAGATALAKRDARSSVPPLPAWAIWNGCSRPMVAATACC